jgi:protein TonB
MVAQEEVKDEAKPEEPPQDEPPAISTNNVGDGPGAMAGLGAYKPGVGNGAGGIGGGGRGGSKYGWYASQVQSSISDALRRNGKTKSAKFSVQARIWADSSGRVVRATISGSSGDAAVDAALKNDVLTGLQLKEAPPADMPMPIVMRLTAKRSTGLASTR